MSNVLVNSSSLTAIASAIRSKLGVQTQYRPSEMASAIESISGGGITPTGTKSITENGVYDISSFASVDVNVSSGGGTMESGTFTVDTNRKTFSLTVPAGVTNFVFYATDFDEGIVDAGWHTVGGVWFNGIAKTFVRYNNNNGSVSSLTVTLTNTTLSGTAKYNLRTEKTYKWYAW